MNTYPRLSEEAYQNKEQWLKEVTEMTSAVTADCWRYYGGKSLSELEKECINTSLHKLFAQKQIDEFNRRFPIGTKCWYWSVVNSGPVRETTIRNGAQMMPSGQLACFVEGVAGCVSIWHITPVDESQRSKLKFA